MNIRHKLYTWGIIAILGSIAIFFTTSQFAQTNDELNRAINQVDKLEVRLLNLRRNEKDFLLRSDAKYLDTFQKNTDLFLNLQTELDAIMLKYELGDSNALRTDLLESNRVLNSWCVPIKPSALIRKVACGKATIRRSSKPNNKLPQKSY
ncbi:putative methyl-accepting chemotaxis protein [Vibrio cholerae]|nr:putative methyl-accepting chemotaxis protein [Vibrio cholerae]